MAEQIERHMDKVKRGGEHPAFDARRFSEKQKKREERRKAKIDPECQPTYNKYQGWEY